MTRRRVALALTAFTLTASSCSVNSRLNQIDDEYAEIVDLVCSCPMAIADCESYFQSPFSFANRGCLEDALATDKAASKETLDCMLDVIKDYRKCVEDNLQCDDPNSSQACAVDVSACPQLPEAVQIEINACGDGGE